MASKLESRLAELRLGIQTKNLPELAMRCGAEYFKEEKCFHLFLFDQRIGISFPELIISDDQTMLPLPESAQNLLLYYLTSADGTPMEGRWISFADLPDGRFYHRAFQGYTGSKLEKKFGNDLDAFESVGDRSGGMKIAYGDSAFAFHVLPRVMIALIYHRGDEEFPVSCRILFDASTSHYLPTDVCAILGSMLTQQLLTA
jgi:hypothetical protein